MAGPGLIGLMFFRGWPEAQTYEEYREQVWADEYERWWFGQLRRLEQGKRDTRPMGWPDWKAKRASPPPLSRAEWSPYAPDRYVTRRLPRSSRCP